LHFHEDKGADLTVAVMHVSPEEVFRFGIMDTDADLRITRFTEKPKHSESKLASMGIYVFNTRFLLRRLEQDAANRESSHDFGKDIIPQMVRQDKVFAYPYSGYWVDVGTISAYWETNLALLRENPALDLYDPGWVIHTRSKERPPVKLGSAGQSHDSLLSNGCVINGMVINSVLSPGVCVERGAVVRDTVIMNDTIVRSGAVVDCCVLDKEIEIGANAQVGVGDDVTPNQLEPANINTGITIAGKRARVPAGAIIGRNCRIDPNTTPEDYRQFPGGDLCLQVKSGATISRRELVGDDVK
jgi:glucose-1-phosphate adenylyltransferase